MPNYRAVHFATETVVQGWDGLCWTTVRTFTGEGHEAAGAALVVALENSEAGSSALGLLFPLASLLVVLMIVLPLLARAVSGLSATSI